MTHDYCHIVWFGGSLERENSENMYIMYMCSIRTITTILFVCEWFDESWWNLMKVNENILSTTCIYNAICLYICYYLCIYVFIIIYKCLYSFIILYKYLYPASSNGKLTTAPPTLLQSVKFQLQKISLSSLFSKLTNSYIFSD